MKPGLSRLGAVFVAAAMMAPPSLASAQSEQAPDR